MNLDFFYARFLNLITINLPALIGLVLCSALTWIYWHRHPPAARRLLFALIWMIVTDLLAICWHSFGIFLVFRDLRHADETPWLLVLSGMEGLGYVWFLLAVNAARMPYRAPHSYYDDDVDVDPRPDRAEAPTPPSDSPPTA